MITKQRILELTPLKKIPMDKVTALVNASHHYEFVFQQLMLGIDVEYNQRQERRLDFITIALRKDLQILSTDPCGGRNCEAIKPEKRDCYLKEVRINAHGEEYFYCLLLNMETKAARGKKSFEDPSKNRYSEEEVLV